MLMLVQTPTQTERIDLELFGIKGFSLHLKREDVIHPFVSGNKFRKLKYNIETAQTLHHTTLLTFGGAFSNHIAAVAAAAKELGMQSIGIIRGEELRNKLEENPTLSYAKNCGMELHVISRDVYRE